MADVCSQLLNLSTTPKFKFSCTNAIQSICLLLVILAFSIYRSSIIEFNETHGEHSSNNITASLLRNVSYSLDSFVSYGHIPFSPRKSLDAPSLIFYKTHKTCSSTVTGILWRFLCSTTCSSSSGSEGQNNLSHYSHDGYENCFVPPTSTPGRTWDFNRRDHTQQILSSIGTACKGPPFTVWVHHAKGKQQSYYHIAPPLPLYQPMNFIFDSCIVVIQSFLLL
jgi:hypothetical protein